jgi:hypothetical protein
MQIRHDRQQTRSTSNMLYHRVWLTNISYLLFLMILSKIFMTIS